MTRRNALRGIIASAGVGMVNTASNALQIPVGSIPDRAKVPGRLASKLGSRSEYEHPERHLYKNLISGRSMTPLEDTYGIITPSDLHFERHHGGVPDIIPSTYELLVHGMVEKPMKFTLEDLKRFPAYSRICFIECSGNGSKGYYKETMPTEITPGQLDGLVSTSEWTGVPLSMLLNEVGMKRGAKWLLAEGSDSAALTRSIPIEKAMKDAMIVYAQNGEAIRPEQGYPARLLLPGFEGNTQVKWIRRIEVSDRPFMTREETSKYTDSLANGKARMFSFVMDAKSIITFPAYPDILPQKGWWEVTGLAWTGRGKIKRVEVSVDEGKTWKKAQLQEPVLPYCATQFRYLWNWNGAQTFLMSRAIDETGYVQPTLDQLVAVRGEASFYHTNNIRAWKVTPQGEVFFGLKDLI